ncbi:dermonecrotic toxin domain-containing protein [Pseudomonas cremoricolorata]|uniref:dermonecrotic toxin domain-containing protein n=1 Tax=Pseudomonas cremoricolorata TaxID=157783 RepID=UPI00040C9BB8|nr:DUF6543 domain-containing protein [Pseudomonas cremoricolorata]
MDYHPKYPEYPAPGEPFSPEPASHPERVLPRGEHNLLSIIPAAPEQDEEILPSIEQSFAREHIVLQTPHDFAAQTLRTLLDQHAIDDSADDLILATLYIDQVHIEQGPWKAQLAHAMTLPQAMLGNWQQRGSGDSLDHLGHPLAWRTDGYAISELGTLEPAELANSEAYDAVYRRTSPQVYGPDNQIALDPATFQRAVWDADLQSKYIGYLQRFWSQHESNYPLMLKGNVVRAALLQRDEGSLSQAHAELVLNSMMLHSNTSWSGTSMRYFADNPMSERHQVRPLLIHRYVATDIVSFQKQGEDDVVLYIPGNASPLHGFASLKELREWIGHTCRDPRRRAVLASHFSRKDRRDGVFYSGVDTALRGLGAYPKRLDDSTGLWSLSSTIRFAAPLYPHTFSCLCDAIKARFYSDADYDISTQADYQRKQVAYGLETATNVVGAIALAVPALDTVAAALGVALLAAGAGEMIAAKDATEAVQGGQRLAFGLLNALPLVGKASQLLVARESLQGAALEALDVAEAAQRRELIQASEVSPQADTGAHWPLLAEFQVQRPVLDSLAPELRAGLAELRVTREVHVSGGGKGVFIDDGKMYINLRKDVYRVQWLEHEQQLRICAENDPASPGPFLTALEDGYWDIQLRFGLRGGDSARQLPVQRLPIQSVDGIQRQPLLPRIETTLALDDISEQSDGYIADVQLSRRQAQALEIDERSVQMPVWYDADAAAWRMYFQDLYLWREKLPFRDKVRWKAGSAEQYERVRHHLPAETLFADYRFPDLPQLPQSAEPISREVHMIWIGDKPVPHKIAWKLRKNLDKGGYRFIIHLDNEPSVFDANRALFESLGIEVQDLREQDFFTRFNENAEGQAYRYFRNPHSPARNYAAAADFLRYRLIEEYGGLYMDVDDELLTLPTTPLHAAPHDVLLGGSYKMPWSGRVRVGNSHFASHPGNPVLRHLLQTANERFQQLPESFLSTARPVQEGPALNAHMQVISTLAGPDAFHQVLSSVRPDYLPLLDYVEGRAAVRSATYDALHREALDHYFPFRLSGPAPIMPGSAHSWISH